MEFFDRKQHWLILLVTAVSSAIIYFAVSGQVELVKNEISSPASLVLSASHGLSNFVTALVMLSVVSIIFLFPRLARKGRVEFYLSKPITRSTLFYGKVISLSLIYGLMILMGGAAAAGVLHFLGALPLSASAYILVLGAAAFLVWLSVVSCVGLLTKSVPISLAAFAVIWIVQLFLNHRSEWGIEQRVVQLTLNAFYYLLPKTSEMSDLSVQLAMGAEAANFLPLFTSLALAGMLTYYSKSVFCQRDF